MDTQAMKDFVRKVREKISVNDVFCTRILKVKGGSVLVGLTADLGSGATPEEAEIATLILGDRVEQLSFDRALAGSLISEKQRDYASAAARRNYSKLIQEKLEKLPDEVNGEQHRLKLATAVRVEDRMGDKV